MNLKDVLASRNIQPAMLTSNALIKDDRQENIGDLLRQLSDMVNGSGKSDLPENVYIGDDEGVPSAEDFKEHNANARNARIQEEMANGTEDGSDFVMQQFAGNDKVEDMAETGVNVNDPAMMELMKMLMGSSQPTDANLGGMDAIMKAATQRGMSMGDLQQLAPMFDRSNAVNQRNAAPANPNALIEAMMAEMISSKVADRGTGFSGSPGPNTKKRTDKYQGKVGDKGERAKKAKGDERVNRNERGKKGQPGKKLKVDREMDLTGEKR